MSDQSSKDPALYYARVKRIVSRGLTDPFSDETRKIKDFLLLASFVLAVTATGIVSVQSSGEAEVFGLKLQLNGALNVLLITLCMYFEIIFVGRSYIEWRFWNLNRWTPLFEIPQVINELVRDSIEDKSFERARRASKAQERLSELEKDPPGVVALLEKKQSLEEDYFAGRLTFSEQSEQRNEPQHSATMTTWEDRLKGMLEAQSVAFYERRNAINNEIEVARAAYKASVKSEVERLTKEKEFDFSAELELLKAFQAKANLFVDGVKVAKTAFRIRYYVERAFPVAFGLIAISFGVWRVYEVGLFR